MKTKRTMVLVVVLSLLLIGGLAACKHRRGPCGFDQFDLQAGINRVASRLDLTEEQKADLDQIAHEITEKARALQEVRSVRQQELANVVRQDSIDQAVVDEMISARFNEMREMVDFASVRLIAFHSNLTPEQREKIAQRIEDHAAEGCRFGFR